VGRLLHRSTKRTEMIWVTLRDLSRTGVPIVLVRYLRALAPAQRHGVAVVARRGGPLWEHLRSLGVSVTVLEDSGTSRRADLVGRSLAVAGLPGAEVVRRQVDRHVLRELPRPDVVVSHGLGGLLVADSVADAGVPLVVHVHELDTGLERAGPRQRVLGLLARASVVMAVSRPVADLVIGAGVAPGRVHIVPGVPDPDGPCSPPPAASGVVVGGIGAPGHRKGTDRFIALAHEVRRSVGASSVWVGGRPEGPDRMWHETPDPVCWLPARPRPWEVLSGVDVLVIPSREDPMPLVALEAGQHGLPVVATATGGLSDLLGDGRGAVVSSHDVPGLIRAVRRFLDDPDEARAAGALLRAHVAAEFDPGSVADAWWRVVVGVAGT
jgi:glycosyltransferase involved in cell wall biosynthesis